MSLDLNSLKENIQSILQGANTTTATRDLSADLDRRVQRILKVNPTRVPIQADWYPFVGVFIDDKTIELQDFAGNQMNAKRKAAVSVKIVGAVCNAVINDAEIDPADEDCESLMENIEEILRGNATLNGVATWSYPSRVTYHNATLDEGVHVRAGMLDLGVVVFY